MSIYLTVTTSLQDVFKLTNENVIRGFLIRHSIGKIFIIGSFLLEAKAWCVSVKGHVRTGSYTSKVKLENDPTGNGINDTKIISSRLNLNILGIHGKDNIVIDVRDKYDFFGANDRELLELKAKNTLQVRQAAYAKPWRYNRFFYTIGRFEMSDAGIYTNDGILMGYRVDRDNRIGLVGGLANRELIAPRNFIAKDKSYDGKQAGVFWTHESSANKDANSSYLSQSLVFGPTVELQEETNHLRYHHLGLFHFDGTQRYTSLFDVDITPNINLRKALLTFSLLDYKYRLETTYRRIHQDDFRLEQDIRDGLEPSKMHSLSGRFIDRFTGNFSTEYDAIISQRINDGLVSYDVGIGFRYRGFISKKMSMGLIAGRRDHYISADNYFRLKLDYYSSNFGIHISEIYRNETYDEGGKKLNPLTSRAELSFYFDEMLRGSTAISYTKDQEVSIFAAYFMIGYHFTGKTSHVRTLPAEFESL